MGLDAATSYQVRVRANESANRRILTMRKSLPWSLVGTGLTNKAGNGAPSFDETGDGT